MIIFKVSSQHSARYKASLANETIHDGKYFTALAHIDAIRAIQDDVVLDFGFAILTLEIESSTAGILNQVLLNICTGRISKGNR